MGFFEKIKAGLTRTKENIDTPSTSSSPES